MRKGMILLVILPIVAQAALAAGAQQQLVQEIDWANRDAPPGTVKVPGEQAGQTAIRVDAAREATAPGLLRHSIALGFDGRVGRSRCSRAEVSGARIALERAAPPGRRASRE